MPYSHATMTGPHIPESRQIAMCIGLPVNGNCLLRLPASGIWLIQLLRTCLLCHNAKMGVNRLFRCSGCALSAANTNVEVMIFFQRGRNLDLEFMHNDRLIYMKNLHVLDIWKHLLILSVHDP